MNFGVTKEATIVGKPTKPTDGRAAGELCGGVEGRA
jgi:hypothetical protein